MSPVAETTRITEFFVLIGEDPLLLEAFERDPRALLEQSGLAEEAIAAVLAGDLDAVNDAVAREVRGERPGGEHAVRKPGEHASPKPKPKPKPKPGEHAPPEPAPPGEHAGDGD
jgi:hypothetical protein